MHGRMLKLFQKRPILGIDITPKAVKLLEISSEKGIFVLKNYGWQAIPPHAVDDIDALALCIKKILNRLSIRSKKVALALPDSAVLHKIIQIKEGTDEEEMEEFILTEVSKYIPFPIEELTFDFEILGSSREGLCEVLLVGSRVEHINRRIEVMARAGLELVALDVVSFAVERAAQLVLKNVSKTCALIDLGARTTHLFVFQEMKLIYSKEEPFTEESFEDAELTRLILLKINHLVQFFYSTTQEKCITHILLAGEFARHKDLADLVQKKLNIPTAIANPFAFMKPGKKLDLNALHKDAPGLMIACGLAIKGY